ncbi:MAG: hypothetical protein JW849_11100, partial [Phycisphaerae bacterium]|nr:hypothetical protein [Phycisphaerae bacterium]
MVITTILLGKKLSAISVQQSAFSYQHSAFGVRRFLFRLTIIRWFSFVFLIVATGASPWFQKPTFFQSPIGTIESQPKQFNRPFGTHGFLSHRFYHGLAPVATFKDKQNENHHKNSQSRFASTLSGGLFHLAGVKGRPKRAVLLS